MPKPQTHTPEDFMTHADRRLHGKTAIVTGASSGIGHRIALELGDAGADVVLVGRNAERLADVGRDLTERGRRAELVPVDLTVPDGPARVVDATLARFGRLDVLVNSAGVFLPEPFDATTDDHLDQQWQVNVRAPYRLTQQVVQHMVDGSSIIFVSSICGHVGFPNSTAYCATKGAVELLVKSLTAELAPRGIRVNAVAPGNVRTSMNAHLLADASYERSMLASTPAGRIGEVTDIAPAVVFLASADASYVHGASLVIDGGWAAS